MHGIWTLLVGSLLGPISGLITTKVFDYVDDVQKWTARLPAWGKQLLVILLAAVIPAANSQWGLHIAACSAGQDAAVCVTNILAQPNIQYIVGLMVAFFLKGHSHSKAAAPSA